MFRLMFKRRYVAAPYILSNGAGEGARRDVEFNSLNLLISHLYVDFKKCSILLLFRKNIAISERNQMFSKNKKTLAGKEGGSKEATDS